MNKKERKRLEKLEDQLYKTISGMREALDALGQLLDQNSSMKEDVDC